MAVSKATRAQVIRRDKSTCRYCGAKAPDVQIQVDHVIPVALGGDDKPSNLVAACVDCNIGKGASAPDEALVDDVSEFDMKWRAAMERASEIANAIPDDEQEVIDAFGAAWDRWSYDGGKAIPISHNWRSIVLGYYRNGLPKSEIVASVEIAMNRRDVAAASMFPYFCGVARNKANSLAEIAARLIEDGEV